MIPTVVQLYDQLHHRSLVSIWSYTTTAYVQSKFLCIILPLSNEEQTLNITIGFYSFATVSIPAIAFILEDVTAAFLRG